MNLQAKGFGVSIVVHTVVVMIILQAGTLLSLQQDHLVVDFSILNHEAQSPVTGKESATLPKQPAKKNAAKPVIEKKPSPHKIVQKKERVKTKRQKIVTAVPSEQEPAVLRNSAIIQKEEIPPPPAVEPLEELAQKTDEVMAEEAVSEIKPAQEMQEEPADKLVEEIPAEEQVVWDFPAPAAGGNLKQGKSQKETAIALYTKSNFNNIRTGVQNLISYPRLAQRMGWEGKVIVSFLVCGDGTVTNIKIVESSGVPALDNNAVATIKKAAPFPKPPIPAQLTVPVIYRLG